MQNLYIAVCAAHADEYRQALLVEQLNGVEVISFPSVCMQKKSICESWRELLENSSIMPDNLIIIAGRQCEVLPNLPDEFQKTQQVALENCFYSYCSRWFIDKLIRDGSYIVTSGWVNNWQENIAVWGFDPDDIRRYFGEFAKTITVLDTGIDTRVERCATDFAEHVGLPVNVVTIDLEYLGLFLKTVVLQWRLKQVDEAALEASQSYVTNAKQIADFAMMFDVVSKIAEVSNETEMIQKLLDTFTILFAPKTTGYYGIGRSFTTENISEENFELALELIRENGQRWCFTASGSGFLLLIEHKQEVFGVLEVDGFAFQEYQSHYLNSMLNIIRVCGLAIANARQYEYVLQSNERLLHAGTHDQLTGLYNRRFYEEQIRIIAASDLQSVGIFVCDVDGLKEINDKMGHAAGDKLLKVAANILKNCFRDEDTVVRLGGDEFAVIIRDCTEAAAISALNRIQTVVSVRKQNGIRGNHSVLLKNTGISVGYALAQAPFENLEATFAVADDAMYLAKKNRKTQLQT